jgi:hypothetical protein
MLILCLTAILQLVAGQYSLTTKLISIPGEPDSCQSREQRATVDVAIQNIHYARDEILSIYMEMVQGRQILMFYTTMVLIANDCGYKILRFGANPQKYQMLVPAKLSFFSLLRFPF